MTIRAKYIIVIAHGMEMPIVFSELMKHTEMAGNQKVVGAGFCYVDHKTGLYTCYGESTSLNIKSRNAVDEDILNELLGQSHD